MPQISVIIPTYNRAKFLATAIDSVLVQTFSDYELIVVDDASTDSTSTLLEKYSSSIQIHTLPENKGVSYARNVGIQHAKSAWIAFLDSDDVWHPQKLEKQWEHIQHHPHYGAYFTDEIWIRNGKRVNPKKKHTKQEGWIYQPSLSLCLMAPSTIMIPQHVFERVGNFDETLPVCEDYDLWLRICALYPVSLLNEKLMTRHGGHSDQLSQKFWGNDRFRIQSLQKILQTVSLTRENQKATCLKMIEKSRILQNGFRKRDQQTEVEEYEQMILWAKKFLR